VEAQYGTKTPIDVATNEKVRRNIVQVIQQDRANPMEENKRSDSSEALNSLAHSQPRTKYRGGVLFILSLNDPHI
jgi:hypothetical protein